MLKVHVVNFLGKRSPATVNRVTGDCYVDKHFLSQPIEYQKYILLHEEGHKEQNTKSEFEADNYASHHYLGTMPKSAKNSIRSLANVLSFTTQEQEKRLKHQIIRAAIWDYKTNGNEKALTLLESIIYNNNNMNTENSQYSNWGLRKKNWKKLARYANPVGGLLAAKDIYAKMNRYEGDEENYEGDDELFEGDELQAVDMFSNFVADTYQKEDGTLDFETYSKEMTEPDEKSSFSDFKAFKKLVSWTKKQADKIPFDAIKSVAQFVPVPGLNQALELREKGRTLLAKAKSGDKPAEVELAKVTEQIKTLPENLQKQSVEVEKVATANVTKTALPSEKNTGTSNLEPKSNPTQTLDNPKTDSQKLLGMPKQTAYIVIGVVVVVIGFAVWYFTRKKR